jgi:hypothetical protein
MFDVHVVLLRGQVKSRCKIKLHEGALKYLSIGSASFNFLALLINRQQPTLSLVS